MNTSNFKLGESLSGSKKINNKQLDFKTVDLNKYHTNIDYITIIPESMARKHNLIAINKINNKLIVAMINPLDFFAIEDVSLYTKLDIEPVLGNSQDILRLIDRYYSGESTKQVLEEFDENYYITETDNVDNVEILEVTSAPIVRLLNSIIEEGIKSKASDIHIEPLYDSIRIRLRINGDLREGMKLSRQILSPIITRIKIMGKMNIAEKRLPQDGRIETTINDQDIDMRISTLPTVHGEKVVIRLLDKGNFNFTTEDLGFSCGNVKKINEILVQPYGMILVTGPTGSGKTTTLYTLLRELNKIEKNIITIEDPVEYKLRGISQVQVNNKSGLNFATGLRSILRQDPDIVMVGEIRDRETAEIAVRAAITGHLVLSTLHTNDSPSTITRLVDMGIEPYLISSAVIGIISQRLVKILCDKCKQAYEASYLQKQLLNIDTNRKLLLYEAAGCNSCNEGYQGRRAIHEIMTIRESLRRLINNGANIDMIKDHALKEGMYTLLEESIELAVQGIISYTEVTKVSFTLE